MLQRLIDFYARSTSIGGHPVHEIWEALASQFQTRLIDALKSGNTDALDVVLSNIGPTGGTQGMENGVCLEQTDPFYAELMARLARRLGVLPIQNPEQESPTKNWQLSHIKSVASGIENELGFKLAVPQCFGMGGGDALPHRFFYYAAAAFTAKQYLGRTPRNILEIGAGLGNLGIIAKHWGSSYAVIDLPQIAVLSAFFTARHGGKESVWLFGEPANTSAEAFFYPNTRFDDLSKSSFDLIFNSDSLPEMTVQAQDEYMRFIEQVLASNGIFLSINHESDKANQGRVLDAVRRNTALRLASRSPFMMRDGYVEEIYVTP